MVDQQRRQELFGGGVPKSDDAKAPTTPEVSEVVSQGSTFQQPMADAGQVTISPTAATNGMPVVKDGEGKEITLDIDMSGLLIGDLKFLDHLAANIKADGEESERAPGELAHLIDLLGRVVIGGVDHIPFRYFEAVTLALRTAIDKQGNPKN